MRVRQRIVDGVDGGIREQVVVARIDALDPVTCGERRGLDGVPRGDTDDGRLQVPARRRDQRHRRDARGAEDSDPERAVRHPSVSGEAEQAGRIAAGHPVDRRRRPAAAEHRR
jgi:hypothetical protein